MALVEVGDCIFDARQLGLARGFECLDPVAREAFVNHLHLDGKDREAEAEKVIDSWTTEMKSRWPECMFRIYRQCEAEELTIRFHMVRPNLPHWCEDGVEVIIVGEK